MARTLKIVPLEIDKESKCVLVEYNGRQSWQRIGNILVEQFLVENIGKEVEVDVGPNLKLYKKGTVKW